MIESRSLWSAQKATLAASSGARPKAARPDIAAPDNSTRSPRVRGPIYFFVSFACDPAIGRARRVPTKANSKLKDVWKLLRKQFGELHLDEEDFVLSMKAYSDDDRWEHAQHRKLLLDEVLAKAPSCSRDIIVGGEDIPDDAQIREVFYSLAPHALDRVEAAAAAKPSSSQPPLPPQQQNLHPQGAEHHLLEQQTGALVEQQKDGGWQQDGQREVEQRLEQLQQSGELGNAAERAASAEALAPASVAARALATSCANGTAEESAPPLPKLSSTSDDARASTLSGGGGCTDASAADMSAPEDVDSTKDGAAAVGKAPQRGATKFVTRVSRPGALWRQKEVDRRKGDRLLSTTTETARTPPSTASIARASRPTRT